MDSTLASDIGLPLQMIDPPLSVKTLDGRPMGTGWVTHQTIPLTFKVGVLHQEAIQFLVINSPHDKLVLGYPWLQTHDPVISWSTGELKSWGPRCAASCLSVPCRSTSIESPSNALPIAETVPSVYHDFSDVFSKTQATKLPPHRPWDCAINLLPGAPLPHSRVYPLSIPETQAMERYVDEALTQGFIRPTTSPAASGFFFVEKKDGGLRPCIDYRALNDCTVKFRYPLPLIPSALEQLRKATLFTKLDLRSAYNLIRIRKGDEWKTAFVITRGHYEYLVMPYGLYNSPAVFQSFMN